jgi:O-antigen/teichoic acid export membrane protein
MHPAKRVAVNNGFLYARMAITVFISLYATRIILNALGAGDFGLFNVVGGAIAMLTFLNTAMAGATQRFMSFAQGEGNFDKQKHIFNVSIVLHFIIAVLVVILLEVAGYFLFNGILKIPSDRI